MREMFSDFIEMWSSANDVSDYLLVFFVTILVLFLVLLLIMGMYNLLDEVIFVRREESSGVIIDKSHRPDTQKTNVGYGVTSGGNVATVITTTGSPEAWFLIIKENATRNIYKIECDIDAVYNFEIGDEVDFRKKYGKISKCFLKAYF